MDALPMDPQAQDLREARDAMRAQIVKEFGLPPMVIGCCTFVEARAAMEEIERVLREHGAQLYDEARE